MNKFIRISSWLIACLLIGAVICMIAFNIIGSEVDAQGVLHEPFFLIPLFWMSLILSLIVGTANILARVIRYTRH